MTTGVYLDEATKDPRQRYKISTGSNGAGAIAVSADGIHWSNEKDLEKETHARWDTPKNVVWDPVVKQWIMYLRSTPTEQGMRIQSFTHSLTDDFMGDWSPATPTGKCLQIVQPTSPPAHQPTSPPAPPPPPPRHPAMCFWLVQSPRAAGVTGSALSSGTYVKPTGATATKTPNGRVRLLKFM